MAGHCKNCNTKLGCSCKRRTASNGKSCCATCLPNYEKVLKQNAAKGIVPNAPGVILNTTAVQKK